MDRFIECKKTITQVASKHLKSNMDRFIGTDGYTAEIIK